MPNSKTLNFSNSWQKKLYGNLSSKCQLDSSERHKQAKKEIKFIIRSLNLQKGQTILDIPCGTGRHTMAFGQKGHFVTGVDISDICLKKARKNCLGIKNVQIKKGNMARLKWAEGKFDVVLNLYTSFGYFKTEKANKQVLKGLIQTLKPGGRIVIQTINREWLLKVFNPLEWAEYSTKFFLLSKREYNPKTKYMEAHQIFLCKKSKRWEKSYHRIRLYSIAEMKALLQGNGLRKIKIFGDISGCKPRRYQSSHPIYIAEIPKSQ